MKKMITKKILKLCNDEYCCDTCMYDFNEGGPCMDCSHKYSSWRLSEEKAEEISEEIIRDILTSEQYAKLFYDKGELDPIIRKANRTTIKGKEG